MGPPVAVSLECGSEVGEEAGHALASPVPPLRWPQLHSRLLVFPLDHLVVLPVLQVGGQLRVLSLLCPLPGSVALKEGGAASSLGEGRGSSLWLPVGEGRPDWPGQPYSLPAQVSQGRGRLQTPRSGPPPRLPSRLPAWPANLLTCWSVFMSEAPASTM